MPAPDAAPLPRDGEVFFDVRGDSRTMRVSWYADTGVAVFSIWHGGTCTGTFRLPIPELPRLLDALSQGPCGDAGFPPGGHADMPPRYDGAPDEYDGAVGQYDGAAHQYDGAAHEYAPLPHGYEDESYGYPDMPRGYADEPTDDYPDFAAGPAYGPPGGDYVPAPSGPLPVGRWHEDEHDGRHFDADPPGSRYGAQDYQPDPDPGVLGDDPLGGDYGGEAELGYLPGPPTETFRPVYHGDGAGRRAGEYRPPPGRSC